MGFLEKKLLEAEEQAGRMINDYRELLAGSDETVSIRRMVSTGAPAGSVGQRAADAHRSLFKQLLEGTDVKQVSKSKSRSAVVEQFCIALWRKHLGDGGYREMTVALGIVKT